MACVFGACQGLGIHPHHTCYSHGHSPKCVVELSYAKLKRRLQTNLKVAPALETTHSWAVSLGSGCRSISCKPEWYCQTIRKVTWCKYPEIIKYCSKNSWWNPIGFRKVKSFYTFSVNHSAYHPSNWKQMADVWANKDFVCCSIIVEKKK